MAKTTVEPFRAEARHRRALRSGLLLVALAAIVVACAPAPPATEAVQPRAAQTQPAVPYLLDGEHVTPVARRIPRTRGVGAAAIRALLRGPTAAERRAGLTSAVPAGTRLLGLSIRGGLATIDLSRRFASGGGSLSMRARVAQVVFTLTRFATVRRVAFRLDGRAVTSIGGEGVIVSPPVDRADFEDLSPIILIESPLREQRVRSPLAVEGTSNTFEARLQVDLLEPGGRRLTRRTLNATSGTGTRGSFQTTLRFVAPEGEQLTLRAYERSAADNHIIHMTRVPLIAGRRGKEPAPPGAIAVALTRAHGHYAADRTIRVHVTLRSQLRPAWSLVTGSHGARGLWAAWVRRSAGAYRVETFRTRDFDPGTAPPCDIRPAFTEPAC
jgi:hypothetical protein